MQSVIELVDSVEIKSAKPQFIIAKKDPSLEIIGIGRSAVVFKIKSTSMALKIFPPVFEHIALEEAKIYALLEGNNFFPSLYEAGNNYLLIDYISGYTLYDCLLKGIPLTELNIKKVDEALHSVKRLGLNPSDIHLRNIMLTSEGTIKLIDVARFRQTTYDSQWDDIKLALSTMYFKKYTPKKIPACILNGIAFLYKKRVVQAPLIKLKKVENK